MEDYYFLNFRAKNNNNLRRKPKYFFSSTKQDFDLYFEDIVSSFFSLQDCAVFYKFDTEFVIPRESYIDLLRMNAFVFVVTNSYLNNPSVSKDNDIQFAKQNNIKILPLVMEEIDWDLYRQYFGNIQSIKMFEKETTEVSHLTKLNISLKPFEVNEELFARISLAFKHTIFLSYRKKDRAYANQLTAKLHEDPRFANVSVWYDEYLQLGEQFNNEIERKIEKSDIFVLLVTNNLVNETNYVETNEYPFAIKNKKRIVAIQMEDVNKKELNKRFPNVPKPYDFKKSFLDKLSGILGLSIASISKEDKYFLGLGYLYGVDVEKNIDLGISLLKQSAGEGLVKAMVFLFEMYFGQGNFILGDMNEALKYAKMSADPNLFPLKERDERYAYALTRLYTIYHSLEMFDEAKEILEKIESSCGHVKGIGNYLITQKIQQCRDRGENLEALSIAEEYYKKNETGQPDDRFMTVLSLLGNILVDLDRSEEAITYFEEMKRLAIKRNGLYCRDYYWAILNIARAYRFLQQIDKTYEISKEAYESAKKYLGENDDLTVIAQENLVLFGQQVEDTLPHAFDVYNKWLDLYGENNKNTKGAAANLISKLIGAKRYDECLDYLNKWLDKTERGDDSFFKFIFAVLFSDYYCQKNTFDLDKLVEYLEIAKSIYEQSEIKEYLGYEKTYRNLHAKSLFFKKEYAAALEKFDLVFEDSRKDYGDDYSAYPFAFYFVGCCHYKLKEYEKCIPYFETFVNVREKQNRKNRDYYDVINTLGNSYYLLEQYDKALSYFLEYFNSWALTNKTELEQIVPQGNIGRTYAKLGNSKETLKYLSTAVELREKFSMDNNEEYAFDLNELAWSLLENKRYDEAIKLYEKCYAIRKEIHGEFYNFTIFSLLNLITVYSNKETCNIEKAKEYAIYLYENLDKVSEKYLQRFKNLLAKIGLNELANSISIS